MNFNLAANLMGSPSVGAMKKAHAEQPASVHSAAKGISNSFPAGHQDGTPNFEEVLDAVLPAKKPESSAGKHEPVKNKNNSDKKYDRDEAEHTRQEFVKDNTINESAAAAVSNSSTAASDREFSPSDSDSKEYKVSPTDSAETTVNEGQETSTLGGTTASIEIQTGGAQGIPLNGITEPEGSVAILPAETNLDFPVSGSSENTEQAAALGLTAVTAETIVLAEEIKGLSGLTTVETGEGSYTSIEGSDTNTESSDTNTEGTPDGSADLTALTGNGSQKVKSTAGEETGNETATHRIDRQESAMDAVQETAESRKQENTGNGNLSSGEQGKSGEPDGKDRMNGFSVSGNEIKADYSSAAYAQSMQKAEAKGTTEISPAVPVHVDKTAFQNFGESTLAGKMVDSIRFMKDNPDENTLLIRLRPAEYGDLQIRITHGVNGISAAIHTDSTAMHSLLSENISQLKESLSGRGIACDQVTIDFQSGQDAGHTNQGNGYQERRFTEESGPIQTGKANSPSFRPAHNTVAGNGNGKINVLA